MTTSLARPLASPVVRPVGTLQPTERASGLRAWQHRYRTWLRVSDTGLVVAAVAVAQVLRFGAVTSDLHVGFATVTYTVISALLGVGWVAVLAIFQTRSPRVLGGGLEEYRRVWAATLSLFGALAVVSTLLRIDLARGYLAIAFPLGLVALTMNRWLTRKYVVGRRADGEFMNTVLAVGRPKSVRALAQSLARSPGDGYKVVGVCGPEMLGRNSLAVSPVESVPVFPCDGDIVQAVLESGADTVAVASGHLSADEIRDLSWRLEKWDVDLVVSPGVIDVAGPRLSLRPAGGSLLIHVDKPQYDGAKQFQKRAFDVCFSALVLLGALPVMLVAAAAIKLTSKGPVFYLSERIGLDGQPFPMIKFRTMVVDADRRLAEVAHLNESGGVLFKIRQDPRVTPVGQFLRRYSIDELPQFINVLRKEMSVVGPRPPLAREVESYDHQVLRRLLVRPGITGLWQVSGRSDLSWEDSVRLDLSYVENWSMLNDLTITAKTVRAVSGGSGAY